MAMKPNRYLIEIFAKACIYRSKKDSAIDQECLSAR